MENVKYFHLFEANCAGHSRQTIEFMAVIWVFEFGSEFEFWFWFGFGFGSVAFICALDRSNSLGSTGDPSAPRCRPSAHVLSWFHLLQLIIVWLGLELR